MSSNDNELPFWNGSLAVYWIIRAEFMLFLACCLHWTSDRRILGTLLGLYLAPVLICIQNPVASFVFLKYRVWAKSYQKPCPVWTSWTELAEIHRVEWMGGGKKVKLGGLLAEKKRERKKKKGGMFAYWIAVNYLVSDYINFKFFYLTWKNPLMQNSLPNQDKDKSSSFLIHLAWIYCCCLTSFSRTPQEWEMVFWFSRSYLYILYIQTY